MCILEFCCSFHLQNQTTSKYFIFIAEICTINSVQCTIIIKTIIMGLAEPPIPPNLSSAWD